MTDWEKTIAEIREALKKASSWGLKSTPWIVVNAPEWLRFLLFELDREREENRKLREERDNLIGGLRTCLMHAGSWDSGDYVSCLRDILKEVGVTVE